MNRDEAVKALQVSIKMSEDRANDIFNTITSRAKFNFCKFTFLMPMEQKSDFWTAYSIFRGLCKEN
jgi:hypothetical protein